MRYVIVALAGSALLNTAFVTIGRGAFGHLLGVIWLIEFVALPFGVAGLLALFGTVDSRARGVGRWAWCVAFAAGSTILSVPVGAAVAERDIWTAKAYCEALVPLLEEYRTTHGSYPRHLGPVAGPAEQPQLLRDGAYYHSDGTGFSFSFRNPSGMMGGFAFDGRTRVWTQWD
jgi:hypothetical protein